MSKKSKQENDDVRKTHEIDKVSVNDLGVRVRGQRLRVRTIVHGDTLTKQADRDRANINCILKKYERTGLLPLRTAQPLQGDIPDVDSFHEAMNIVVAGQQAFDQLPSNIRERFDENPAEFLKFATDPKNIEEMRELGLARPEELQETLNVRMVSDDPETNNGSQDDPEAKDDNKNPAE